MAHPKRKHIVAAVATVLESGDYDTAEALAEAVIETVDQARDIIRTFTVVCQSTSSQVPYLAYGPFATQKQAVTAYESGQLGGAVWRAKAVVPTYTPEHVEAQLRYADLPLEASGDYAAVLEDAALYAAKKTKGKRKRTW